MPMGGHFEDIRVRCPVMWSWMTVLLQYWQDHMTPHLYGGRFCRISDLAATVIRDINLWLPHQARFGWGYVAMNTTLWIDQQDHFSVEHLGGVGRAEGAGVCSSTTWKGIRKWCTGPAL